MTDPVSCQACKRFVLPSAAGDCPACGKPVDGSIPARGNAPSPHDPGVSRLEKACLWYAWLGPVVFTVAVVFVNMHLPRLVGFNTQHPLSTLTIRGATFIGLMGLFAFPHLVKGKITRGHHGLITLILTGLLFTWNALGVFVIFSKWHGFYRLPW